MQVKSRADQAKLKSFIERADAAGIYDRLFFACHTPAGALTVPNGRDDVHIWSAERLAETALRNGLADWVLEKIA